MCVNCSLMGFQISSPGMGGRTASNYRRWIPGINWALHKGLCRLFTLETICEEILPQRQQSIITAVCMPVLFTRKALCTHDSEVRFLVCVAAFNIHGTHSLKIFPCRPPIVIAAQTRTQKPETQKVDKMYKNNTVNT